MAVSESTDKPHQQASPNGQPASVQPGAIAAVRLPIAQTEIKQTPLASQSNNATESENLPSSTQQGTILQLVSCTPRSDGITEVTRRDSAQAAQTQEAPSTAVQNQDVQIEPEQPSASLWPSYMAATACMPKPPLQGYTHANEEAIAVAFSCSCPLGIRSLPNALSPGFRHKLYEEILSQHVIQREQLRQSQQASTGDLPSQPKLAYTNTAYSSEIPFARGQRQVIRSHPYAGTFSTYNNLQSEYERGDMSTKLMRLSNRLAQVTQQEFVVRSTPIAPRGAPAFCEFSYDMEPSMTQERMRRLDDMIARDGALAGPFVTAGRAKPPASLRCCVDNCMKELCKLLSQDWPSSFLQVFEDKSGALVMCFDRSLAVLEGDLSAYMQQLVKNHWIMSEYRLTKDGAQWGLEDQDTQSVFYLVWPPWVRHRFVGQQTGNPAATMTTATTTTATLDATGLSNSLPTTQEQFSARSGRAEQEGFQGVHRFNSDLKIEMLGSLSRSAAETRLASAEVRINSSRAGQPPASPGLVLAGM